MTKGNFVILFTRGHKCYRWAVVICSHSFNCGVGMFEFIDLFCGIGGFRVALENKGLNCVFSCDIDLIVQSIYEKNFGDKPDGDVTSIPTKKIPPHDVLCAGFPCQPFSISGKMDGLTTDNGRLFYEIARIADYHMPKFLLLENVKNILSIDGGNVAKIIENKFESMGYVVHHHILNASFFGIPQARERVYFLIIRKDVAEGVEYLPPKETFDRVFLNDVLEERVDESLVVKRDDIVITKEDDELTNDLKPIRIGYLNKGGQGERIYSIKGHAVTLSAFGGGIGAKTGLYNTPLGVRRLTITESKRIMGFKDSHYVSDGTRGYTQLGNAVIPQIVERIWDGITWR
ncbi:MAG: DNA cytosine methyltransferase [Puniceicoccales bacterium]|nr:DNA cytosine methyltransferase [Puniceicoccales bacterium]